MPPGLRQQRRKRTELPVPSPWHRLPNLNARFTQVVFGRLFATGSSVVSGLILLRIFPRYVPTDEWGVVNVALQILVYLPLIDGGFRLVLNRELLASRPDQRAVLLRFGQSLAHRLTLAALVAGPLLTLAFSFSRAARGTPLPPSFYIAVGVAGAVTFASSMQVLSLVGLDRQGLMSLVQGGGSAINIGVFWLALHGGLGVWAFPVGQAASALGMWCASAALMRALAPGTRIFSWAWTDECRALWKTHAAGAWAVFRMQLFIVLLLGLDLVIAACVTKDAPVLAAYVIVARVLGMGRGFLTSLGEATWPRIASGDADPGGLTRRVLALNAWCYGLASGLLAGALPAMLAWYMTKKGWTAAPVLHGLLVARFLVIGLTSPASYSLIGSGDFKTMARCVGRELALGTLAAIPAGWFFGANGVAAAFLASTVAGTFFPIFAAYARRHSLSPAPLFAAIWLRSLVSGCVAAGVSAVLIARGWTGAASVGAATVGGLAGLVVAMSFAAWRGRTLPGEGMAQRLWAGL